jgi:hypothetical protein
VAGAAPDAASDDDGSFPPGATIGSCVSTKWTASASASAVADPPTNAIDGILVSRWSTGVAQAPGQYHQIDFGGYVRLTQIVLDSTGSTGDHPRGFQAETSTDGVDFSNVIGSGAPGDVAQDQVTIDFPPRAVRYLRVELTAAGGSWWSIHEFRVACQIPDGQGGWVTDRPPPDADLCAADDGGIPTPDPPARTSWTATASATSAFPADVITNAFDNSSTSRWSSGKAQAGDEWFKLDLGAVGCISQVSIASPLALDGGPATDFPVAYALFVSTDDSKYTVVASGAGQALLPISFMPHKARYLRINQFGMSGSWWSISNITVQR